MQITLFPFLLITLLAHSLVEHSSLHNQTLDCEMEIEEVNLGYSHKNIPISSNQTYLKSMVGKLESFVSPLRQTMFHFMNKNQEGDSNDSFDSFGFKSESAAPQNEYLHSTTFRE